MAHQPRKMLDLLSMSTQGDLGALTMYTSQRGKLVIFPRAPPLNPPSLEQARQRQQFNATAIAWWSLTNEQRTAWKTAAIRAHLRITGYNLWTYWRLTGDKPTIETIERQAAISLL